MSINKTSLEFRKKARPVGVTILGGWLIFQGFVAFGYSSQFGIWAWIMAALFAVVGIGLLRLQKEAYIATLVIFLAIFLWALYIILIYGIVEYTGAAIILSGLIMFYLSRRKVRYYFFNIQ